MTPFWSTRGVRLPPSLKLRRTAVALAEAGQPDQQADAARTSGRVRLRRGAMVVMVGLVAAVAWLRCGPLPTGLLDFRNAESTVVVDRHGEVLYEARSSDGS